MSVALDALIRSIPQGSSNKFNLRKHGLHLFECSKKFLYF